MASGNQTYNGICADLPVAPMKKQMPMNVGRWNPKMVSCMSNGTADRSTSKSNVAASCRCKPQKSANAPTTNARSPTRLTRNAFIPAIAFCTSVNQKPMRR